MAPNPAIPRLNKIILNNFIVKNRIPVRNGKKLVIRNLKTRMKSFRRMTAKTEKEKEKNNRKADQLSTEISALMKIYEEDITKFAILNKKTLDDLDKDPNPKLEEKAMIRIATHKMVAPEIEKFREMYPDYGNKVPQILRTLGLKNRKYRLSRLQRKGIKDRFLQIEYETLPIIQRLIYPTEDPDRFAKADKILESIKQDEDERKAAKKKKYEAIQNGSEETKEAMAESSEETEEAMAEVSEETEEAMAESSEETEGAVTEGSDSDDNQESNETDLNHKLREKSSPSLKNLQEKNSLSSKKLQEKSSLSSKKLKEKSSPSPKKLQEKSSPSPKKLLEKGSLSPGESKIPKCKKSKKNKKTGLLEKFESESSIQSVEDQTSKANNDDQISEDKVSDNDSNHTNHVLNDEKLDEEGCQQSDEELVSQMSDENGEEGSVDFDSGESVLDEENLYEEGYQPSDEELGSQMSDENGEEGNVDYDSEGSEIDENFEGQEITSIWDNVKVKSPKRKKKKKLCSSDNEEDSSEDSGSEESDEDTFIQNEIKGLKKKSQSNLDDGEDAFDNRNQVIKSKGTVEVKRLDLSDRKLVKTFLKSSTKAEEDDDEEEDFFVSKPVAKEKKNKVDDDNDEKDESYDDQNNFDEDNDRQFDFSNRKRFLDRNFKDIWGQTADATYAMIRGRKGFRGRGKRGGLDGDTPQGFEGSGDDSSRGFNDRGRGGFNHYDRRGFNNSNRRFGGRGSSFGNVNMIPLGSDERIGSFSSKNNSGGHSSWGSKNQFERSSEDKMNPAQRDDAFNPAGKRGRFERKGSSDRNYSDNNSVVPKPDNKGSQLHPSWMAKQKEREKASKIHNFQGQVKRFDFD